MRAEYTEDEDRDLRITEIEAILENGLYADHEEEKELEYELRGLKAARKRDQT